MKSVLISIQPKWCELIANGKKTIEVRKTRPQIDTPFKCYIYCTKPKGKNDFGLCLDRDISGNLNIIGLLFKQNYETALNMGMDILSGKVIGEFVCDDIRWRNGLNFVVKEDGEATLKGTCLTKEEVYSYLGVKAGMNRYDKKTEFYCWHISDLVIYDKPKELSEFFMYCGDNPKCDGCEAHYYSNTECGKEDYCCSIIDGHRPIKRPPQSWCYVQKGGAE